MSCYGGQQKHKQHKFLMKISTFRHYCCAKISKDKMWLYTLSSDNFINNVVAFKFFENCRPLFTLSKICCKRQHKSLNA